MLTYFATFSDFNMIFLLEFNVLEFKNTGSLSGRHSKNPPLCPAFKIIAVKAELMQSLAKSGLLSSHGCCCWQWHHLAGCALPHTLKSINMTLYSIHKYKYFTDTIRIVSKRSLILGTIWHKPFVIPVLLLLGQSHPSKKCMN